MELKRGAKAAKVIQLLHKKTSLQSTFGAILIALDHGEPKEFTLLELLERFRDHRIEVIQRRSRHDLEQAEAEKHTVEGLLAALGAIEEVIAIIRSPRTGRRPPSGCRISWASRRSRPMPSSTCGLPGSRPWSGTSSRSG